MSNLLTPTLNGIRDRIERHTGKRLDEVVSRSDFKDHFIALQINQFVATGTIRKYIYEWWKENGYKNDACKPFQSPYAI